MTSSDTAMRVKALTDLFDTAPQLLFAAKSKFPRVSGPSDCIPRIRTRYSGDVVDGLLEPANQEPSNAATVLSHPWRERSLLPHVRQNDRFSQTKQSENEFR